MQTQQIILALAISWLITLVILPFLFATARRRAFAHGLETGKVTRNTELNRYVKALETDLAYKAAELDAAKKNFTQAMNARLDTIAELEARVMSYTGLAVTQADHQMLRNASETLALAFKTWTSMPGTDPWRCRATTQAVGLNALATRIGAELRMAPAAASIESAGEEA